MKEQFQSSLSIGYLGPMKTKFQFQMLNMTEDPQTLLKEIRAT